MPLLASSILDTITRGLRDRRDLTTSIARADTLSEVLGLVQRVSRDYLAALPTACELPLVDDLDSAAEAIQRMIGHFHERLERTDPAETAYRERVQRLLVHLGEAARRLEDYPARTKEPES